MSAVLSPSFLKRGKKIKIYLALGIMERDLRDAPA
jgi:hypothetical protein